MKANHNDHNYQNCCFSYYPGNDYGQVFPMPNIGMPQQITYVYSYYYPMAPQFESPQMAPSL